MTAQEPGTVWAKSSLSVGNGACVEVAALDSGGVLMRNSSDPGGPVLRFTRAEWDAFTGGVLLGEFDRPGTFEDAAPAKAVATGLVDRRCGHRWCDGKNAYRMIGGCYNCGTSPLLGLFTVTHEAEGGDCPVCGCSRLHWNRLAGDDEIPAGFEAQP